MGNVIVRAGPDKGKHLSHLALPYALRRAETSISMKGSSIFQGVAYANLIEENILLEKPSIETIRKIEYNHVLLFNRTKQNKFVKNQTKTKLITSKGK